MKYLTSLLLLPLLTLDCLGNLLIGGSFKNTISAEAWHQRDSKYWSWTHKAIDCLFFWQTDHCKAQASREDLYGSVWAAWVDSLKRSVS